MYSRGDRLRISYIGTCASDNSFVDIKEPDDPLELVVGRKQIFPPIEEALMDMEIGETAVVTVPARYGFGEIDPDAIRSFPLITMPNWQKLEEGMYIEVSSDRAALPGRALVSSLKNDVLVLDFNHPMAGKDLIYEVTLEAVNAEPLKKPVTKRMFEELRYV